MWKLFKTSSTNKKQKKSGKHENQTIIIQERILAIAEKKSPEDNNVGQQLKRKSKTTTTKCRWMDNFKRLTRSSLGRRSMKVRDRTNWRFIAKKLPLGNTPQDGARTK